jgi:ABC-type bacteriocin/lantibiotic exporter with double-glycine peptidase domain
MMESNRGTWSQKSRAALFHAGLVICLGSIPMGFQWVRAHPQAVHRARAWWNDAEYLGETEGIPQTTSNDCGVICLKTVLSMKGIQADLPELRREARTSSSGASLLGLKQAAEAHGLQASTWRLNPNDLQRVQLAAIAFVDGNHFVVVVEVTADEFITVLDPARGRLRFTAAAFRRHWRGETLLFANVDEVSAWVSQP